MAFVEEAVAKIMPLRLSLSGIFFLVLVSPFWAEDYVSKDIPPNEIIIKSVQAEMVKSDHNLSHQNLKKSLANIKRKRTHMYIF